MKNKIGKAIYLCVVLLLLAYIIGPANILVTALRIYNGTSVQNSDYAIQLPDNLAIINASSHGTQIVGFKSDANEQNMFYVNLYDLGYVPTALTAKWAKCDHKTWFPLTTNEGKNLALSLCTFDFNKSTSQKPSLMLVDGNRSIIAAAGDWKPYYNDQYLKVFKSIKIINNSAITELPEDLMK